MTEISWLVESGSLRMTVRAEGPEAAAEKALRNPPEEAEYLGTLMKIKALDRNPLGRRPYYIETLSFVEKAGLLRIPDDEPLFGAFEEEWKALEASWDKRPSSP